MDPLTVVVALAWLAIGLLALAQSRLLLEVRSLRGHAWGSQRLGPVLGSSVGTLGSVDLADGPTLVVFAEGSCATCRDVVPRLITRSESRELARVRIVIATSDDGAWIASGSRVTVLAHQEDARREWGIAVTPYAVVVVDGRVEAAEPIGSTRALDRFLGRDRQKALNGKVAAS